MSHSPSPDPALLEAELCGTLPGRLAVGGGTAVVLVGRARHPAGAIERIEVGMNGNFVPALAHARGVPRWAEEHDAWWALVPVLPVGAARRTPLELRASLRGGAVASAELGSVELTPAHDDPQPLPAAARRQPGKPVVAVCMATWNPPRELLERQIGSIRAQTHGNFACFISDDGSRPDALAAIRELAAGDERFVVCGCSERVGFYRNFERALALVPRDAEFVALADQDDSWAPEKLETLLGSFDRETSLVYSDMRIVDETGALISPTFWSHRPTNHTDLRKLLIANTITGAASMFRRELLELALPFPERFGELFHDHWLAVVALATGTVAYVDRPLYDYVQHGDATQGHARANLGALPAERLRFRGLRRAKAVAVARRIPPHYVQVYLPARILATVLDLRAAGDLRPDKQSIVRTFARTPARLGPWLAGASLRRGLRSSPTLGRERDFLTGMAWEAASRRRGRMGLGTVAGDAEWS